MKRFLIIIISVFFTLTSTALLARSDVEDVEISNRSTNVRTTTESSGRRSTATTGSVTVKDSKVKDTEMTNNSTNRNTRTTSSGHDSTATTGSITVE